MRIFSFRKIPPNGNSYTNADSVSPLVGLPTYHELRPLLEREIRRCRRYERPLTLLVVGLQRLTARNGTDPDRKHAANGVTGSGTNGKDTSPTFAKGKQADVHDANANGGMNGKSANGHAKAGPLVPSSLTAQLGFLLLGSLLRGTVRETDIVAYAPEGHHFVVALPESEMAAGELAIARLNDLCFERTSLVLRVGIACFPADGLSLDDLVEHARHAWREEPLIETASNLTNGNAT